MSQEYIEITEKNLSDAITAACQKLSVTSDKLDYVVIDQGKSGFLGIGARPAKIKARVKAAADETQAILDDILGRAEKKVQKEQPKQEKKEEPVKAPRKTPQEKKEKKQPEKVVEAVEKQEQKEVAPVVTAESDRKEKKVDSEKKEGKKNSRNRRNRKPQGNRQNGAEKKVEQTPAAKPAPRKKAAIPQLTDEQIADVKKKADVFLKDVFGAMNMEVTISEEYDKENGVLTINMEGEDMGVLIGKRGQTLDSMQYLVSLVVNKGVEGYIHVKADTENYRERRKKTLENLAKNIAFKVKKTRRNVTLEPMNPYERRIIHSALQNDKFVTTFSEGEEPYRKVVVALKKNNNSKHSENVEKVQDEAEE